MREWEQTDTRLPTGGILFSFFFKMRSRADSHGENNTNMGKRKWMDLMAQSLRRPSREAVYIAHPGQREDSPLRKRNRGCAQTDAWSVRRQTQRRSNSQLLAINSFQKS